MQANTPHWMFHMIIQSCHQDAKEAGWWPMLDDDIDRYGNVDLSNPYLFSSKLMLIVSELAEALEGDRKNLMDDKIAIYQARETELADAVIRIFDLAGAYNLRLADAFFDKLNYNKTRQDHTTEARNSVNGKKY
jgi:NTP pyrophosphatase (non-canonical NTP hydrolase)